jgi:hypothetical protein
MLTKNWLGCILGDLIPTHLVTLLKTAARSRIKMNLKISVDDGLAVQVVDGADDLGAVEPGVDVKELVLAGINGQNIFFRSTSIK